MGIRAGDLRHTITIRRKLSAQNAKGGYDITWQTVSTRRAKVEGLDGRESRAELVMVGISSFRITTRWLAGIQPADQLVLPDGTELNIRSANDPDGRRTDLVIMADTGAVQMETA